MKYFCIRVNSCLEMLLKILAVFLFASVSFASPIVTREAAVVERYGSGFTDVTNFTNIPYVAVLYSPLDNEFAGCGVILNDMWMLTVQLVGVTVKAKQSHYFAYQNVKNPTTLATNTKKPKLKVKGVITHHNFPVWPFIFNLALIKVCPKFETCTFATIPPPTQTYLVGSEVDVYIYARGEGPFQTTKNTIKAKSDCDYFSDSKYRNPEYHYCEGAEDSDHEINRSDIEKCAIITQDGKFIGFSMDNGMEITMVLKIETMATWINKNMNSTCDNIIKM